MVQAVMRILYAICGWGLGHATRSLPILRRLVADGHEVFVHSDGAALALVARELGGRVRPIGAPAYPNIFGGALARTFFRQAPRLVAAMRAEHRAAEAIVRAHRIDRVVSDSRWGVSSRRVPSLFISHHLRQLAPPGLRTAEWLTEAVTWRALHGRYRRILVPDVAAGGGLSGRLAHGLHFYRPGEVRYVGLLADVDPRPVPRDIETLVVLTGPEPSRTRLERRLVEGMRALPGRTVVLRGVPGTDVPPWPLPSIEALPHADKPARDALFSAARVIVSRSGYTTVMDLARVGTPALLVPMRGQTEQQYLALRLAEDGRVRAVSERAVDLARDVPAAAACRGLGDLATGGADAVDAVLEELAA
jgi:UDP:flavonoid glycosyltransferase YjiC (YdhE family)